MNRKKIFALMLALVMMLGIIAACGNKKEEDSLHKDGKQD